MECTTTQPIVQKLLSHLTIDTLVVGMTLPGHLFTPIEGNIVALNGRTCPWNTCAIWSADYLSKLGFPLIGDGIRGNRTIGGVEEVSAITLLQVLYPHLKAKLIQCEDNGRGNNSAWETAFEDPIRQQYHDNKMKSKIDRPQQQMETWGSTGTSGKVMHIVDL